MGIKCITPPSHTDRYLEEKARMLRQKLLAILQFLGNEAVKEARNRGRYKDQTGNLRSSIGYCIADNGKTVVESSFDVVKNGQQGAAGGRKFLKSLVSGHSKGLVLIVVAGMEYAAYVEAKNLNVLDSAEQLAGKLLPQMLKALRI